VKTLSSGYEGKKFNSPNDLAIDAAGTSIQRPPLSRQKPRELDSKGCSSSDGDGTTTSPPRDLQKPKRHSRLPDGKHLYVSDNNAEGNRKSCFPLAEMRGR